ncbi:MAG: murein biosynthesis integral membrane protein MurJ [Pelagibacterales bacterium]|nr:murein biosynthesis integral membrane protein MurJ [Pelagibacterales bacterium]
MQIFRSFFTISFFISLSRILGFIRDMLIARFIGVSVISDAFFAAFRLPNFFRRVFAEGAFNSAFVPIFVEKLQDSKEERSDLTFVRNIFSLLFFALLIFTIIFQIFMPLFMKILFPGFFNDPEKSNLLISFSRITIFYLIFISLVSLFSGILNSLNKFAVPASSPIILNSTLIFSIFVFSKFNENYGYALSWGVFLAGILQFLWLFFFTFKSGFLLYPKIPVFNKDIKKFFRKLLPGIVGANVMQINLLLDSIFASMITGAVSYLYYADRINQLPLAMIGIAIGIALLPTLSRKIKSGENEQAIKLQNAALEVGLILVIPATLALTCLAYPIISSLFERGAFTSDQSLNVARALMFYSFGLPAYVLVKVMEPAFFSRGNTRSPMNIAILCLISNGVLNVIFYFSNLGFVGIILASIISSYLNLTLLITTLIKKNNFYFERGFLKKLLLILIPSLLMADSLIMMRLYFDNEDSLNKVIELIIMVSSGIAVYAIASYFSGSLDILIKSRMFKKKRDN